MVSALTINSSDEAVNAITSLEEWALLKKEYSLKKALDELLLLIRWENQASGLNKKLIEVETSLWIILGSIPIGWNDNDRDNAKQALEIYNIILALKWFYKIELRSVFESRKIEKLPIPPRRMHASRTRSKKKPENSLKWKLLIDKQEVAPQRKTNWFEERIKKIEFSNDVISDFWNTHESLICGGLTTSERKTLRARLKELTLLLFSWVVINDNLPSAFFDDMNIELNAFIENIASKKASLRRNFIKKEIAKIALWFSDKCIAIFNTTRKWEQIAKK